MKKILLTILFSLMITMGFSQRLVTYTRDYDQYYANRCDRAEYMCLNECGIHYYGRPHWHYIDFYDYPRVVISVGSHYHAKPAPAHHKPTNPAHYGTHNIAPRPSDHHMAPPPQVKPSSSARPSAPSHSSSRPASSSRSTPHSSVKHRKI